MTHFTGALPRSSRASLSLGHAGATKVSTTNLPSGPLRTTTVPPGPDSIVTLSASFCDWRGAALNLARILASRSAAEGAACALLIAEARSDVEEKSCASRAPPANVTEPRNISRREVCFCKKLNFIFLRPFFCALGYFFAAYRLESCVLLLVTLFVLLSVMSYAN